MPAFQLLRDGEPRGARSDEPRDDGLSLDEETECWRNAKDEPVCGACLTKRSYEWRRCQAMNLYENGRCYHHGGKTPTGRDHGAFKHGKYSKDLPARISERYDEVREDESLTNLREEIALVETRIHHVLESLDAKDSAALWKEIEEEFERFKEAEAVGDSQTQVAAIRALTGLIEEGASQRDKWEEVGALVERKRKLVESERRREKALQAYVPLERFSILLTAIDDIIRRNVANDSVMRDIAREIKQTVQLG